jgi:hypothetical protein
VYVHLSGTSTVSLNTPPAYGHPSGPMTSAAMKEREERSGKQGERERVLC